MTPDLEARLRKMAETVLGLIHYQQSDGWDGEQQRILAILCEVAALAAQEQRERDARMVESGVRPNYYARALAAAIRATAPERSE